VLIALVTGPNSTQLHLMQFMPVARAVNAKIAQTDCSSSAQDVSF